MAKARVIHDDRKGLFSVADEFLVVCPGCKSCASIRWRDPQDHTLFAPRRFVCEKCGMAKDWTGNSINWGSTYGPPMDPVFRFPLWLQAPCCGQTLWAYNPKHLTFIAQYVAADLRQRKPDKQHGWCNRSLASRLPRWIIARKNRETILRTIAKLKKRLVDCDGKRSQPDTEEANG